MKTVEIIGYKRANLGKKEAKKLRSEAMVPAVLYGGDQHVHFYAPMILFRELVYTSEAHFVNLNIEGDEYQGILQDVTFHPVSEIILHADFSSTAGKPCYFFSAASDIIPLVSAWRQEPEVDYKYEQDDQTHKWVTTGRYGVKLFRPENMVSVVTSTAIA